MADGERIALHASNSVINQATAGFSMKKNMDVTISLQLFLFGLGGDCLA